jgi:hypothetical protein
MRQTRRFVAAVVGMTFVCGCTSWHTVRLRPERFNADSSPAHVRLTLADSTRVLATHPALQGDSLIWSASTGGAPSAPVRHAVPTAAVRQVEVHSVSGGRTALLILGAGLLALVIGTCHELAGAGC